MRAASQDPDVLVVDDDADIRETVSDVLADERYRVAEAHNGQQALDLLRGGVRPRVILVDLMMPELDGEAFCRQWALDPAFVHIPVVMISAHPASAQTARRCRAAAFLRKPFKLEDLLRTVQRFAPLPP